MTSWLTHEIEQELTDRARQSAPHECAGLIGVDQGGRTLIFPCPIEFTSPTGFYIPAKVFWDLRTANGELVAIYHSHPSGNDRLSPRDLMSMKIGDSPTYPGVEWLIIPYTNDRVAKLVRYVWCPDRLGFTKRS
jgi:proteasome lid subunit RPN8/RPN11